MADTKNETVQNSSEAKKSKKTQEKKESFFEGVKKEFKKIIWPNRTRLIRESTAVVAVSVVLGAVIALLDAVIKYGVDYLIQL